MQDIYQVDLPEQPAGLRVFVRGVVADLNEDPVKARIILMDADGRGDRRHVQHQRTDRSLPDGARARTANTR